MLCIILSFAFNLQCGSVHIVRTDWKKCISAVWNLYFLVGWSSQWQNLWRASEIQIRLNCGAVVTWSRLSLLRSTKWGPGDHWNHRIIFYLFYRFFWPKKKKGNTSPSSHLKDMELNCGANPDDRGLRWHCGAWCRAVLSAGGCGGTALARLSGKAERPSTLIANRYL